MTSTTSSTRHFTGAGGLRLAADDWPGPEMRIGIHSGPVYFARPGNRFWFGRYTGWTPVSGRPDRDGAEGEPDEPELQQLSMF